jgi:hypothetical protein
MKFNVFNMYFDTRRAHRGGRHCPFLGLLPRDAANVQYL